MRRDYVTFISYFGAALQSAESYTNKAQEGSQNSPVILGEPEGLSLCTRGFVREYERAGVYAREV